MRFLFLLLLFLTVGQLSATVFHLDPNTGDLNNDGSAELRWPGLEEVINAGYIRSYRYGNLPYDGSNNLQVINPNGPVLPGDTLLLYDGLHGDAVLHQYNNPAFITILAEKSATPVIRRVHLRAATRWRFVGVTVSSEPYGEYVQDPCFWLNSHSWQGPVSRIEIMDCHLYSTLDNSAWTAEDWRARVRRGIGNDGDHNVFKNNLLENLSFGITFVGDSVTVVNNEVRYFAGDGLRILGSYGLVEGNVIHGCIKIDDNHDDGIQSFNLGTYRVDYNVVRGNIIKNYVDPTAPHILSAPLQGIGAFDGPFTGWVVENNVVSVDHWHGITFLGAFDMQLINNTVIDPSPTVTPGPSWIRIDDHKDGTPSERNLIANNITNQIAGEGFRAPYNATFASFFDYDRHFMDSPAADFRLRDNSSLIDTGIDSLAADFDFLGVRRPAGTAADPGAYEFDETTTIVSIKDMLAPRVFPNPGREVIAITFPQTVATATTIGIFDVSGKLVSRVSIVPGTLVTEISIGNFPPGAYWFRAGQWSGQFIKQ